jgi:hypothetical protein
MWNHRIMESWDQVIKKSRNQKMLNHILNEKYVNH